MRAICLKEQTKKKREELLGTDFKGPSVDVFLLGNLYLKGKPYTDPSEAVDKQYVDERFANIDDKVLKGKVIPDRLYPSFKADLINNVSENNFKLPDVVRNNRYHKPVFDNRGRIVGGQSGTFSAKMDDIESIDYNTIKYPNNLKAEMHIKDFQKSLYLSKENANNITKPVKLNKYNQGGNTIIPEAEIKNISTQYFNGTINGKMDAGTAPGAKSKDGLEDYQNDIGKGWKNDNKRNGRFDLTIMNRKHRYIDLPIAAKVLTFSKDKVVFGVYGNGEYYSGEITDDGNYTDVDKRMLKRGKIPVPLVGGVRYYKDSTCFLFGDRLMIIFRTNDTAILRYYKVKGKLIEHEGIPDRTLRYGDFIVSEENLVVLNKVSGQQSVAYSLTSDGMLGAEKSIPIDLSKPCIDRVIVDVGKWMYGFHRVSGDSITVYRLEHNDGVPVSSWQLYDPLNGRMSSKDICDYVRFKNSMYLITFEYGKIVKGKRTEEFYVFNGFNINAEGDMSMGDSFKIQGRTTHFAAGSMKTGTTWLTGQTTLYPTPDMYTHFTIVNGFLHTVVGWDNKKIGEFHKSAEHPKPDVDRDIERTGIGTTIYNVIYTS